MTRYNCTTIVELLVLYTMMIIQKIAVRYRYSLILLRELAVTDFKLRYQNSVLGYLWSLLKPFSQFFILYIMFVKIMNMGGNLPHAGVSLLLGIVLWSYFTEVTNGSVNAIVGRGDLLRKINFPRYIVIVSGSVSALINLTINLAVVFVFMLINGVTITWHIAIMPLLVFQLFIFALAVSFLLSSLYVKFRDVGHIWDVIMQGAFFATPIMYEIGFIATKSEVGAKILINSPIAQIIQDARHNLISPEYATIATILGGKIYYLIPLSIVAVTAFVSVIYFRKRSPYFAEEV